MSSEVQSMLAMFSILFLLFCAIVNVLSNPAISLNQCKSNDDACVTKAINLAIPMIIEANPEIGAESMDPMFQPEIEGNLSILKFKLFNTTVTGFKNCKAKSGKFDEAAQTLKIEALCPGFTLNGAYDINGRLIILPVEGNGDYTLITKTYHLIIDLELKTITGKDGKSYRSVKNFKVEADPQEPVTFDFRNLFNGQKDLAEAVLKFANENWKEVAHEVQSPVFVANIKRIVKNANKYLKTLPIDEYVAQ